MVGHGVPLGSGVEAWDDSQPSDQVTFHALRCTRWRTHPDHYSGEVPLHVTWRDQPIGPRVLPRESDIADDGWRQPQLPTGTGYEPAPTVGSLRIAWADCGPAEGLLEEAEGVLNGKTPHVPVPDSTQVRLGADLQSRPAITGVVAASAWAGAQPERA